MTMPATPAERLAQAALDSILRCPPGAGSQELAAAKQLEMLGDIYRLLLRRRQRGVSANYDQFLNVLNRAVQIDLDPPLFTVTIINDGPGTIQYQLRYGMGAWNTLLNGEVGTFSVVEVDAEHDIGLTSMGLRLTAGATASVRVPGMY